MREFLDGSSLLLTFAKPPRSQDELSALYRSVGRSLSAREEELAALLALSHTPVEQKLYEAMARRADKENSICKATVRGLMALTGVGSYSTIRRGLAGLISKLSIERKTSATETRRRTGGSVYVVYNPEEIFTRRRAAGRDPYPQEVAGNLLRAKGLQVAVKRVASHGELSRREAQVALCCAEGLTNAEIGARLFISEQTVKFHLRQIFTKLHVKRRADLIALLLRP